MKNQRLKFNGAILFETLKLIDVLGPIMKGKKKEMDRLESLENPAILHLTYFFFNFSGSTKNQGHGFNPIAILTFSKSVNCLGLNIGTHKSPKIQVCCSQFFMSFSRFVKNQLLKFDMTTMFGLLETTNDSD